MGHVPALENLPPHNEDGAGGDHFYSPWWLYQEQKAGKLDFARGYHIEMGGSRDMPGGDNPVPEDLSQGSYGSKFKQDARRYYGSMIGFAARGEMIPNENCYADLDPKVKDKFGIPVLRFHWKWSDHEINQAKHAEKTFAAMIEAMGGTPSAARAAVPVRARAWKTPGKLSTKSAERLSVRGTRRNPSATNGTRLGM